MYAADVEVILEEHCSDCHAGQSVAGGYRVDSYIRATGCSDGSPRQSVVSPAAPRALLPWTLRFDDAHRELLAAGERATVEAWVLGGSPQRAGGLHGADPVRSGRPGFHGKLAALDGFAPLTDGEHAWACGQCHRGAPAGGEPASVPVGATPCTDCHNEADGVLACNTCHRDPADPMTGAVGLDGCVRAPEESAHAAHLSPDAIMAVRLDCDSCHPAADARLRGQHGDGRIDVILTLPDGLPAAPAPEFDSATGRCASYCHDPSGSGAQPSWSGAVELTCDGCHDSPPANHYAGECSDCHLQSNAEGSALTGSGPGTDHLNGRVDVGDGSRCGGCHGSGSDPWPDTPSHRAHRDTALTDRIACGSCHVVPERANAAGHLDRDRETPADVRLDLSHRADPDAEVVYADGRCTNIVCHSGDGQSGEGAGRFRWDEPEPDLGCTGCHGAPPPVPHAQNDGCAQLRCHGGQVGFSEGGPVISAAGRAHHLDGVVTGGPITPSQ